MKPAPGRTRRTPPRRVAPARGRSRGRARCGVRERHVHPDAGARSRWRPARLRGRGSAGALVVGQQTTHRIDGEPPERRGDARSWSRSRSKQVRSSSGSSGRSAVPGAGRQGSPGRAAVRAHAPRGPPVPGEARGRAASESRWARTTPSPGCPAMVCAHATARGTGDVCHAPYHGRSSQEDRHERPAPPRADQPTPTEPPQQPWAQPPSGQQPQPASGQPPTVSQPYAALPVRPTASTPNSPTPTALRPNSPTPNSPTPAVPADLWPGSPTASSPTPAAVPTDLWPAGSGSQIVPAGVRGAGRRRGVPRGRHGRRLGHGRCGAVHAGERLYPAALCHGPGMLALADRRAPVVHGGDHGDPAGIG